MKVEAGFRVHIVEGFQARGAIFAVSPHSEEIVFRSDNASEMILGGSNVDILHSTVGMSLGREVAHALRNAEAMPLLRYHRCYLGKFDFPGGRHRLEVHSIGELLVVDAIPVTKQWQPSAYSVLADVRLLASALETERDGLAGLTRITSLLRTMSGYHCVSLHYFDDNRERQVILSGQSSLAHVSCGPATQLRVVEDILAEPTDLTISLPGIPPDLALSALSLPAKRHLADLCSAGVRAFAAVDVLRDGRVFGSLRFLHQKPRVLNDRTELSVGHILPLLAERMLNLRV